MVGNVPWSQGDNTAWSATMVTTLSTMFDNMVGNEKPWYHGQSDAGDFTIYVLSNSIGYAINWDQAFCQQQKLDLRFRWLTQQSDPTLNFISI